MAGLSLAALSLINVKTDFYSFSIFVSIFFTFPVENLFFLIGDSIFSKPNGLDLRKTLLNQFADCFHVCQKRFSLICFKKCSQLFVIV